MENSFRTMYARHRNAAGITQEKAAELLGCAVRTVQAYESGEIVPPDRCWRWSTCGHPAAWAGR